MVGYQERFSQISKASTHSVNGRWNLGIRRQENLFTQIFFVLFNAYFFLIWENIFLNVKNISKIIMQLKSHISYKMINWE